MNLGDRIPKIIDGTMPLVTWAFRLISSICWNGCVFSFFFNVINITPDFYISDVQVNFTKNRLWNWPQRTLILSLSFVGSWLL